MTNPKLAVSASVVRYLLALDALKGAGGIRTTDVARYLNIKKPSAHTMSAAASETTKGSAMGRATTMHRAVQTTRTAIEAAAISSKGERYPIADDCASIVRERFRPTYNGAKLAMPATIPSTIARTIFVKSPVAMRPSVQT